MIDLALLGKCIGPLHLHVLVASCYLQHPAIGSKVMSYQGVKNQEFNPRSWCVPMVTSRKFISPTLHGLTEHGTLWGISSKDERVLDVT